MTPAGEAGTLLLRPVKTEEEDAPLARRPRGSRARHPRRERRGVFEAETIPGGLLGADYEVANGRYRCKKVFGGLNWTPDLRAPLTEPGVDVAAGQYLLAIEGRGLRHPDDLYERFERTAGRIVEITVGPNPDVTGSRTVKRPAFPKRSLPAR